jgi:hypothetical protein
MRYS